MFQNNPRHALFRIELLLGLILAKADASRTRKLGVEDCFKIEGGV